MPKPRGLERNGRSSSQLWLAPANTKYERQEFPASLLISLRFSLVVDDRIRDRK
jgi:hypothetical protein